MQLDYTWLSGTSDVGCHGNSFIIGIWDLRYNSLQERVPIGGKHIRPRKPRKLLMELARLPACVGGILANEVVKRSLSQHCPELFSSPERIGGNIGFSRSGVDFVQHALSEIIPKGAA